MQRNTNAFALLLLGAAPRLAAAALIIVAIWAGFFWATAPVGG